MTSNNKSHEGVYPHWGVDDVFTSALLSTHYEQRPRLARDPQHKIPPRPCLDKVLPSNSDHPSSTRTSTHVFRERVSASAKMDINRELSVSIEYQSQTSSNSTTTGSPPKQSCTHVGISNNKSTYSPNWPPI